MARARLGAEMDAVRPAIAEDAAELLSARHPLLGDAAVPIDLRLGDRFGYRALVVTGPNTGGKTVSLKTLGLLALMHQAGLRVPGGRWRAPAGLRRVMADIGDEQSIAQSLSTFSSHLRNVVRFVDVAGPATLVLLDEVGAGTDPTEGSALAMAIVTRLLDAGAMVAATTHYAELKTFATEHAGVTNAAVEFDVTTLRPTYRLTIGLPGKSQAFAIAERLGLPGRSWPMPASASRPSTPRWRRRWRPYRGRAGPGGGARGGEAERASAAEERELARSGVARARREAAELLADARRAADDLLARAEREVADLRREMTRQRNLAGGRRGASAAAFDELSRRAARADGDRVAGPEVAADDPERAAAARRPVGSLTDARQRRAHRRDQRTHRPRDARDRGRAPGGPGRRRRGRR